MLLNKVQMDKESIMTIVKTIHESSVKNKEVYYQDIYKNFKKKYPNLYSMACGKTVDMVTLEYMLDMMDKVQNNVTDQHQASVEVGQKLFDQFVDPKVKEKLKEKASPPA
jgi:hypothetical protein